MYYNIKTSGLIYLPHTPKIITTGTVTWLLGTVRATVCLIRYRTSDILRKARITDTLGNGSFRNNNLTTGDRGYCIIYAPLPPETSWQTSTTLFEHFGQLELLQILITRADTNFCHNIIWSCHYCLSP